LPRCVKLQREPGLAIITLDGPHRLNLMTRQMIGDLGEAVRELERDASIRAVIVTGADDRAFTAGIDVNEMKDLTPSTARRFITDLHRTMAGLRDLEKVIIAAINGFCFGAGCELAMACDLRIASQNAQLGLPEIKVGIPSVIEAALMPLLIGRGRASELVLLGDPVGAVEAREIGLVNRVVPTGELMLAARRLAEQVLGYGPTAVRMQKRILTRWLPPDLEAAIRESVEAFTQCFETREPAEAMSAFLEKRLPDFHRETP